MIRLPRRFAVRIALLFLVLLFLMGIAQAYLTIRMTNSRRIEIDQIVNWNLARDMASEIAPVSIETGNIIGVESAIHYMMVLNPAIEVYVLDSAGNILAYFVEPGRELEMSSVRMEPILDFMNEKRTLPLYGDDPRNPDRKKHFSAADIEFSDGSTGYLYIVLQSTIYDMAEDMLQEKILSRAITQALAMSLVIFGVLGLVLFSLLTKRLQGVVRSVREFERGDMSRRIDVQSRDEIGELAAAFNAMADTIGEQLEKLKRNDELRRELVANVSHDLRNPLTSIHGFVETLLLKKSELNSDEVGRYLEIILGESNRVNTLVHELFEHSKLEAREIEPSPESLSLMELIHDVCGTYAALAEKREVTLTRELPEKLLVVRADVHMVERVLSNLIDNALKFVAPKTGEVIIRASETAGAIRVEVADNGPGIPADDIGRIFDRFYTKDRNRQEGRPGGSGLGLAIARRMLELHDSALVVESAVGKGSTFSFELPIEEA